MKLNLILSSKATDYILSNKGNQSAAAYINQLLTELSNHVFYDKGNTNGTKYSNTDK